MVRGLSGSPRHDCPLWQAVYDSERLGDSTKRVYLNAVNEWLTFAGDRPSAWTLAHTQEWYKALCKRITVRSANCRIAALKYASKRWAALQQRPDLDFAAAVEIRRDEGGKIVRSLSFDEAGELLAACSGTRPADLRDFAAVTLGLRTGMRRMSIVAMRFEKLETTQVEVPIKGGRLHKVPLDDTAVDALGPWLRFLKKSGISSGPIFRSVTAQGEIGTEALSVEGLWKTLRRRARRAQIDDFSPHVLRHTFVTWCREAGVPDYQIAAVTGHKGGAGLERILGVYTDKGVGRAALEAIPADLWGRK